MARPYPLWLHFRRRDTTNGHRREKGIACALDDWPTVSRRRTGMRQRAKTDEIIRAALDSFQIELPSWGFANTGTRFGKFLQPAAAATIEEKFSDAAELHRLTGV